MTAKRRAAIRKARAISARKWRRKQNIHKAGKVAAGIGAVFFSAQIARYSHNPRELGRDYRDLKRGAYFVRQKIRPRKQAAVRRVSPSFQSGPWV